MCGGDALAGPPHDEVGVSVVDLHALTPVAVTEYGVRFDTGVPVTFRFVRNTERAPHFGARFQQDIEPGGRYLLHNPDPGDLPRGWETGTASFESPLVIAFSLAGDVGPDEPIYGPTSWKAQIARAFGKGGRALSAALRVAGYDAVVTVSLNRNKRNGRPVDTREIVALDPDRQLRADAPRRNSPSHAPGAIGAIDAAFDRVRALAPGVARGWQHCADADREHADSPRQYMHTLCADAPRGVVCVARAARRLSDANLRALFAHEFGHLALHPRKHTEHDADAWASELLGTTVRYDAQAVQTTGRGCDRPTALRRYNRSRLSR